MRRSLGRFRRAVVRRATRSIPPLRRWRPRDGFSEAWWDRFYGRKYDPYGLDSSPYERSKFEHVMQALGGRRYGKALEVGCSIGSFTERLAAACDEVVAIDLVQAAVDRARARLAGTPGVRVERRALPAQWPEGRFDLVVCSDVLYYLPLPELARAVRRLGDLLRPRGSFLALHYLGDFGQPSMGDQVHDLLPRVLEGFVSVRSERRTGIGPRGAGYRLDRFDLAPPGVQVPPGGERRVMAARRAQRPTAHDRPG